MTHQMRPVEQDRSARPALLRALGAILALAAATTLAVACNDAPAASAAPRWDSRSVGESIKSTPFTPVIVNSNIGRGPTRLALALLKRDQTLVTEGKVTARLFRLDVDPEKNPTVSTLLDRYELTARIVDVGDHGAMRFDRDERGRTMLDVAQRDTRPVVATLPAHDGALSAIFTVVVDFQEPGMWGAELEVKTGSKTYRNLLLTFAVLERTAEPSIGELAPRTKQKIAKDVSSLAEIDSSTTPNPALHNITVADAIASGKPTLVAFVTPAFCQTRFCGPVLTNAVLPVQQQYNGRVNVIHIEPYDLPAARRGTLTAVPAAQEWNLRSEPFIGILDGQGRVTAKFEGIIDFAEIKQALDAVLAAK